MPPKYDPNPDNVTLADFQRVFFEERNAFDAFKTDQKITNERNTINSKKIDDYFSERFNNLSDNLIYSNPPFAWYNTGKDWQEIIKVNYTRTGVLNPGLEGAIGDRKDKLGGQVDAETEKIPFLYAVWEALRISDNRRKRATAAASEQEEKQPAVTKKATPEQEEKATPVVPKKARASKQGQASTPKPAQAKKTGLIDLVLYEEVIPIDLISKHLGLDNSRVQS